MSTEQSPMQLVRAYHEAWTSDRVAEAMEYVAEDVRCAAPGLDINGREQYREFIGGFAPMLTGVADIASFDDGERVALFYYPKTAVTDTAPAAECFTVRGNRIVESVLVFDRLSFAPEHR